MQSGAIKRAPGESFASFAARQKAAQAAEKVAAPTRRRKRQAPVSEDQTPFGQGDNLGESPDF